MLARNALLVDDSKSARFVLGKLLERHDFNVEMVASAEDALEFLAENKPDAIFMDHLMKGMDGLVATSVIKKNPATAHIPVVMCTSNDGEQYLAEAKLHGALGTLVKPPSDDKLEEILIAINKAIDNNKPTSKAFQPHAVSQTGKSGPGYAGRTPEPAKTISEEEIEAMVGSSVSARIALIEESLEAQLKQQRDELGNLLEKKLDALQSNSMGRLEIEDFLNERLARVNESITDQIGGIKQKLGDEIISSAKLFRHVQEIAVETAISTAEEKAAVVARNLAYTAQSSVQETINPALEAKIEQRIAAVEKSAKSQALTFAVMAALFGAGAAAVLFFLVT